MNALPTGRRGQALALAVTVLAVALLWLGAAAPALQWYGERQEHLADQQTLGLRMAAIAATAPALQAQLAGLNSAGVGAGAPAARTVLDGATDAIAGAALQQSLQDMAGRVGASITSAEALPAETVGPYRRIGLHVTANGGWPVIVALFGAVAQATPRMLVDDVSLRQSLALGQPEGRPVQASFTVIAFHAGAATAP